MFLQCHLWRKFNAHRDLNFKELKYFVGIGDSCCLGKGTEDSSVDLQFQQVISTIFRTKWGAELTYVSGDDQDADHYHTGVGD